MRKWLNKFCFWRRKPPAPSARPVAQYKFGMTLEYFRSQPNRIEDMRTLMRTPFFQSVMSVLQHEIPLDSTIEAVRGHRRCMRLMEIMAEPLPKPEDEVQATFGAEKEFPDLNHPEEHE